MHQCEWRSLFAQLMRNGEKQLMAPVFVLVITKTHYAAPQSPREPLYKATVTDG